MQFSETPFTIIAACRPRTLTLTLYNHIVATYDDTMLLGPLSRNRSTLVLRLWHCVKYFGNLHEMLNVLPSTSALSVKWCPRIQRNVHVLVIYAENCINYLSPGTTNSTKWYLFGTGFSSSRQWQRKQEAIANGEETVDQWLPIWSFWTDGVSFTRSIRWHKSMLVLWNCVKYFWNHHEMLNVLPSTSALSVKQCQRNPKKCPCVGNICTGWFHHLQYLHAAWAAV